MDKLQAFYKSKTWQKFRNVVVASNTDADGYVHCAICGKPILKRYDLIVHHKTELTEENCDDALIALNEANVECVHFRCHNQIHNRFSDGHTASFTQYHKKKVYIVYGAPCAGKSTWVRDNATDQDLIVDLDNIWQMISKNDRYTKPAVLKSVVFEMRDKLYDVIKYRSGKWHDAYIITGGAYLGERERLAQRVGADDFIFIDTPYDECMKRCASRGDKAEEWRGYVDEWFNVFQLDAVLPDELKDETDTPPYAK